LTTTLSLTELKVREVAAGVASGAFTPDDVIEASLARIAEVDDRVQAWTILDEQGARAQAAALTAEAAAGKLRGPLHGVPFAIKDEFHIAGMPTLMRGDSPPPEPADATCVARLRAAGAIIVGKTTMPINGKMPPTRNPWNLEHTAGGTSSGSGAAVGARMVPFAIGEQTAGSNLRPAAYNGVAGLKPTYGRISRFGCYPFAWSRDHVGLIGLDMADIALVLSVLAGPDPLDPSTIQEPAPPADLDMASYAKPRIGVVKNFFPERTGAAMQSAVDSAAERFAAGGAAVVDVMLPEEYALTWTAAAAISAEGATMNAGADLPARLGQRASELLPATYYIQARRIRTWLVEMISKMYGDFDALLMAVAPTPAPKGLESTGDASLLSCWSYLGFPAITVNAGITAENLPLGIQLVGAPKQDYELMRLGAWCEGVLGLLPAPVVGPMPSV
jgi:aspartyl-tRNA(Asn)/glutamyl-tRNA(Gln) amidotransferase subunit A